MPKTSLYDLARNRWNDAADEENQWTALGEAIDRMHDEAIAALLAPPVKKSEPANWQIAVTKGVRLILEHPYGQVCKHWALAQILSELEHAGFSQPDAFVKAVVKSDDTTALTFENIFET